MHVCLRLHSGVSKDTVEQKQQIDYNGRSTHNLLPASLGFDHHEHTDQEGQHHQHKDEKTNGKWPTRSNGTHWKLAFVAAAQEEAIQVPYHLATSRVVLYLVAFLGISDLCILDVLLDGRLDYLLIRQSVEILHLNCG